MPSELIIIAATALLAGLLFMGIVLAGRGVDGSGQLAVAPHASPGRAALDQHAPAAGGPAATLRVVWWLTIAIVLLGVGISGSFASDQAPIFAVGAAAVLAVVIFHETVGSGHRGRFVNLAELVAATALIGGLLVLTGHAGSPFAMLFALVAVAAALAFGPRAGLLSAGLATVAFAIVLLLDPSLPTYGSEDILRLSVGLVATWLLAFVAVTYSGLQRRAMQGVIDLSRTDPLTGLFNRSQLFLTLEQEVSRTRRSDRGFCVLMIDVDGLKRINDEAGHLRGDEVLRALGSVIAGSIRTVDSAYRYGGDEFVVLLPETAIVGAFFVAEKIRIGAEEVGAALAGGGDPVTSVSIGLVSHPEDGVGAEQLIAAADRAMYEAKKLGKNQISGNPRPRPPLLARRPVEEAAAPSPGPARTPAAAPEVEEVAPAAPESTMAAAPSGTAGPASGNGAAEDRAAAIQVGPVVAPPPAVTEVDDEEPDPQVVRRHMATASQSFDPDHQIRRAMDAFLSPGAGDPERRTPDH